MSFEGPIWEDLYSRFGKDSVRGTIDWGSHFRDLPCHCDFSTIADDFKEMTRIGVPYLDAVNAAIGFLAERNAMEEARRLSEFVCRPGSLRAQLAKYLFDIRAMVALRHLEDENFFLDDYWSYCKPFSLGLASRTSNTIFPHGKTNTLGKFVLKTMSDVHLGLVEYLMDSGRHKIHPAESVGLNSPMLMALLNHTCLPVTKLMVQRNAPFRYVGSRNPFGIPDSLLVTMYNNPSMLPFLLKVGGMALEVPVKVSPPESDKNYRPFVCCELRRFRGMLALVAEFSLILPLCVKCKDTSHLESSIPSLQSICRMTYRSQFSPSQLLVDDFPLPEHYPELYCEYLRFENSPFDSPEFLEAMTERNPEKFKDPEHFLIPGEDISDGLYPFDYESDSDGYGFDDYDEDSHHGSDHEYDLEYEFDHDRLFSDPEFDPEDYL